MTESGDQYHDARAAEHTDQNGMIVSEHHVPADGIQQHPPERNTGKEADCRTDDGKADVFHKVDRADRPVFQTDRLHNADLPELLTDRKADRKAQHNKRDQNEEKADCQNDARNGDRDEKCHPDQSL